MIEVSNLTKKYGDHVAVNDLSFTIETGQIYGFLGPNGAGKSTTMNMMTGYLAPTAGKIVINGVDIKDNPEEAKKNIGYLPELPPVYMDMTVNEYLKFVAELKQVPREERKAQIEEVKNMTKVKDVENRLIKNLSKGYRQRVGLAQAIIGYPEVIILDEPMVGLDPKQIIEIRDLIKELGKNHTVILSSHILSEISAVCDHILIISKGNLVAHDSPENLMAGTDKKSTVIVTAKADVAACEDILKGFENISASTQFNAEDGETKMTIESTNGDDIREKLFFAFADRRIAIVEMTKPVTHTLEDVFLELTEKEVGTKEILKKRRKKKEVIPEAAEEAAAETEIQEEVKEEKPEETTVTEEGGENNEGNI